MNVLLITEVLIPPSGYVISKAGVGKHPISPALPGLASAVGQLDVFALRTSLSPPVNTNLPRAAAFPWISEDDTVMQDDLAWSVPARADQADDAYPPKESNQRREATRAAIQPLRAPDPLPAA